jgi:glucose/arabinose dehydrogenase
MSTLRTLVLLTGLGLALGGFSRFGLPAWRSLFAYSVEAGPIFASSVAPVEPDGGAPAVRLTPVITGLSQPTDIQAIPGRPHLLVVAEKEGRARIFDLRTSPPTELGDLLRLSVRSASEQGLLGIAFHPRFAENGRLFASYSTDGPTKAGNSRISAWTADPKADRPVARGERSLLEVEQPAPNHNGGQIVFGPDGLLYIAFGDGGRAGDPWGNAQNPDVLLGKMLRIDVDRQDPGLAYAIPPSNPFVGRVGHRAEIFALGLRNPWRFSFGPAGQLLTGDVGQDAWEEVDVVPIGGNLGWDRREGRHCFEVSPCSAEGLVEPIFEYPHGDQGQSITGGVVYTGAALPALRGRYLFGDFVSGRLWSLAPPTQPKATEAQSLGDTDLLISTFGRDGAGEVYVADFRGTVYRLDPP